jgi:hypothetical protein
MKIERVIGVWSEESVEQDPSVPAGRTVAILVPGPFAIDVDEVDSSS